MSKVTSGSVSTSKSIQPLATALSSEPLSSRPTKRQRGLPIPMPSSTSPLSHSSSDDSKDDHRHESNLRDLPSPIPEEPINGYEMSPSVDSYVSDENSDLSAPHYEVLSSASSASSGLKVHIGVEENLYSEMKRERVLEYINNLKKAAGGDDEGASLDLDVTQRYAEVTGRSVAPVPPPTRDTESWKNKAGHKEEEKTEVEEPHEDDFLCYSSGYQLERKKQIDTVENTRGIMEQILEEESDIDNNPMRVNAMIDWEENFANASKPDAFVNDKTPTTVISNSPVMLPLRSKASIESDPDVAMYSSDDGSSMQSNSTSEDNPQINDEEKVSMRRDIN
eukprot:5450044-Ditylum_brightwellii.AAC.1